MRVKDRTVAQLTFNKSQNRDIIYITNDDNTGIICLYKDGENGKYTVEAIGDITVIDVKGRSEDIKYNTWNLIKGKLINNKNDRECAREIVHIEYLAKTVDVKLPNKYDIVKAIIDNLTPLTNEAIIDCLTGVIGDDWALGRGSIEVEDQSNL